MKLLRFTIAGILLLSITWMCSPRLNNTIKKDEAVTIANDSLEYEITIVDIGFRNYLNTVARPVGYYTQRYLENWNAIYVITWNYRVNNPQRYDSRIYFNLIDYNPKIDYGMEVNYKLFNYFQFAQQKYNMRLDSDNSQKPIIR